MSRALQRSKIERPILSRAASTRLTGRNHHMNNMGGITEVATAFPGNTGVRPTAIAPLAEILRLSITRPRHGRSAASGRSIDARRIRVRTSFYGFLGGETNQWAPLIYDGTITVEPPHDPDYHFMTDMTDQAINWMRSVKALAPDKPFFLYFAPGAVHAPR